MWDLIWHNTRMTSGYQFFSMKQPFFPIGKNVVKVLDALGDHGWVPTASPNYGGPLDDKASVDWPMIVFKKDTAELYEKQTLLMAVKDQNIPGKLMACGPAEVISQLKGSFAARLKQVSPAAQEAFDEYDTQQEWDVVWRETSITSGMQAFSLAKPYFPKGQVVLPLLEEVYKLGWHLVCGPNFGGIKVDWPCLVFKKLKQPSTSGALAFGAVKDQNIPGKFCITTTPSELTAVTQTIHEALRKVSGNEGITIEKDEYDADHGQVIRKTSITTGAMAFGTSYFPRKESILAITRSMGAKGWKLEACPMFGGMGASWPTFVWHQTGQVMETAIVAIKDQSYPGKVVLGGVEKDVAKKLMDCFAVMSGPQVENKNDSYDQDYDLAFRHTKMTSGKAICSLQNSWWPYGYPMEVILGELMQRGWEPAGGPAFGSMQLSWPAVILQREKPTA
ncbi:unnamed protein product [Durusdinium trenchii]|uniref:Uncharacterized protein n=2 Tax=Durusdinium trenchii TaxID=1381693 RepID=A0ABP0S5Z5_9DINO